MNLNVIAPTSSVYFLNNIVPLSSEAMYQRPFYNTALINQQWFNQPYYAMGSSYFMMQQPSAITSLYNQPLTWGY